MAKKRNRRVLRVILCTFILCFLSSTALALYVDKDNTIEMKGKVQTRFSFRTEDSSGFTFPEVSAGDWVQFRNIAYLEMTHDLHKVMDKTWLLAPFEALKLDVQYHLVGRFLYEGIYEVGPDQFQMVKDENYDVIREFESDISLWEAYADLSRGSMFFRIGKQNLSWGETDVFRLLDQINPLDNTFGGFFEDLDDRRIPIMMVRGSYNFGRIGPLGNVTLESFWNPTPMDNTVSPFAPYGSVYAFPAPPPTEGVETRFIEPEKNMDDSRYGFRLQGMMADNFAFSVAHYRSYVDVPALRVVLDPGPVQELVYSDINVTGGSLNFYEGFTDTVFRSEVTWTWDMPIFIPETNAPLLLGIPESGTIPTKGMLGFMVGFDKNMWIRLLNKRNTFFVSAQYFGQWFPDFDERMRVAAVSFSTGEFETIKELEQSMTLLISTSYRSGTINPQLAFVYDPRGAYMIQPQLTFVWEPIRFLIQWTAVNGEQHGIGFFNDRDQLTVGLSVLF